MNILNKSINLISKIQIIAICGVAISLWLFKTSMYAAAFSLGIATSYLILSLINKSFDFKYFRNYLPMLLLSIVYCISVTYSENKVEALNRLPYYSFLLIFPLIFIFMGKEFWTKKTIKYILFSFVGGCLIMFLYNMYAFYVGLGIKYPELTLLKHGKYLEFINYIMFSFEYFTADFYVIHRSYSSMYYTFAISIIVFAFFEYRSWFKPLLIKILAPILILIFLSMIVILSSKAALIGLITFFIILLIYLFKKKKLILFYSCILMIFLGAGLTYIYMPSSFARIQNTIHNICGINFKQNERMRDILIEQDKDIIKTTDASTNHRIYIWKAALNTIKDKPIFGVGLTDLDSAMRKNNSDLKNMEWLDPHNQLLHTSITSGIMGLFVLLYTLLYGFIIAFRKKDVMFLFFLLLCCINILTESIIEMHLGRAFFTLFYCLFIARNFYGEPKKGGN